MGGLVLILCVGGASRVRERRNTRRVVLTPRLNVYSAMFEHKHSQNAVVDGIQAYKQTCKKIQRMMTNEHYAIQWHTGTKK